MHALAIVQLFSLVAVVPDSSGDSTASQTQGGVVSPVKIIDVSPVNFPRGPGSRKETVKAARERRIKEACRSTSGNWYVKIKGISLSAVGSDVDEIYGSISVGGSSVNMGQSSNSILGGGRGKFDLWASEKSVNLGARARTDLSTITYEVQSTFGARVPVGVILSLRDEDDARGGGNDEFFYVDQNRTNEAWRNWYYFHFNIPTCAESPEFERHERRIIVGTARGSASGNKVLLHIDVRAFRKYQ